MRIDRGFVRSSERGTLVPGGKQPLDRLSTTGLHKESSMRTIALLAVAISLSMTPVHAEEGGKGPRIGLIDVGYIFKNRKPAVEKLATIRPAVVELEKTVQLRNVEIEQAQRKLAGAADNESRGKLQQQLIKLQTDLQQFINAERQNLQRQELK